MLNSGTTTDQTKPVSNADGIVIAPVSDKQGRNAFLRVPYEVYQPGDNWIAPLLLERHDHIDPKNNPYFEHAETAHWIAYQDGRPVGRISAQICALYQERYNDKIGQFGFLDAIDDRAVFKRLLDTAQAWLKNHGMKHVQGPFSYSINDEVGLLIDGFDTPPSMMMGHAKPYYAGHLEALGYEKVRDLIAYDYQLDIEMPRAARSMIKRAKADGDLKIRPFSKPDFARDVAIILDIYNEAWSENWGYVPMTDAEITTLGKNLKMLIKGGYISIAELKGRPVAMAVSLPNINDAITDMNGKLGLFGLVKLLWRLKAKPPKSVRLTLLGVVKEFHGTPLGAALALAVIDAVRAYHKSQGTMQAELSWILEDNLPMRRMIEMIGGREYKTYRVYQRTFGSENKNG